MADYTSDVDMPDAPVIGEPSQRATSHKKPNNKKSEVLKPQGAGKPRAEPKKSVTAESESSDSDEDYDENDIQPKNGLDLSLPPVSDVTSAFKDLVKRACSLAGPGKNTLLNVANSGGFIMRVATMCSGTEAPIFALRLIQEAFCAQNQKELFRFHHIFSVEIENFKQAYIKRNTGAMVFRDVREFTRGDGEDFTATTAVGSEQKVDADVDLLVAGTSCIQFSKLNPKFKKHWLTKELRDRIKELESAYQNTAIPYSQQALNFSHEKVNEILRTLATHIYTLGESDATFFSLLIFANNHRPKIIILENVKEAPYKTAVILFRSIAYAADFVDVDTKDYYLPQTRQRKYLVAVRMDLLSGSQDILQEWSENLASLKRRASSPLTEFLLESTSTLTRLSSQQLEYQAQNKTMREPSWERSKDRHDQARENENLGNGHPFSGLGKGLTTNFYDRVNRVVMHRQPPRVWECGDIHLLRGMTAIWPFDAMFKTRVWDFSQNVDRNKGGAPPGLIGCITPNGFPYISSQGRFVAGIECLILQGLDPSHTDLSRESHDQLKDLAGNAMSTTVVGAVFLSLIMACIQTSSFFGGADSTGNNPDGFSSISEHDRRYIHPFSTTNSLEVLQNNLSPVRTFRTWNFTSVPWKTVLIDLARDQRMYCYCNGTAMYSTKALLQCRVCGTIRCKRCAGNPVHEYEPIVTLPKPQSQEKAELLFLKHFPSTIRGMFPDTLADELSKRLMVPMVADILGTAVFCFERVHLTETVTISFVTGSGLRLKATIFNEDLIWYLHLEPHSLLGKEVMKDKNLGKFCLEGKPVARAIVTHNENSPLPFFDDWVPWNFGPAPGKKYADLLLRATRRDNNGDGGSCIQLEQLDNHELCPAIEKIFKSILGTYDHKPQCDAAERSLYVRKSEGAPMFLFKDPTRTGHASLDTFVISYNPRLIQSHEHRETLVSFKPAVKNEQLHNLEPGRPHLAMIAIDGFWEEKRDELSLAKDLRAFSANCDDDNRLIATLKVARVHQRDNRVLQKLAWRYETTDHWVTVPEHDLRDIFKAINFAKVKLINHMDPLTTKIMVTACTAKCIATPPPVFWTRVKGDAILKPVHQIQDIEEYERSLKEQLPVFQVQARVFDNQASRDNVLLESIHDARQDIEIRFVFSPTRLAHRALRYLPNINKRLNEPDPKVNLSAFTEPGHADSLVLELSPFSKSIRALPIDGLKCEQPPSFQSGLKLEPEQRVTVRWMVDRETRPAEFTEREIEEELVPHLQLRLVGCAERTITCGGGIIADDVGFGKTVMSIALIDLQRDHDIATYITRKQKEHQHGLVALNATLIIVPPHIVDQWANEITRFLGPTIHKELVVIREWKELGRPRHDILKRARIIVVSDTVFTDPKYTGQLSHWAGRANPGWNVARIKQKPGRISKWTRAYQEWHDDCTAKIADFQGKFMANPESREELISEIQEQFQKIESRDKFLFDNRIKPSIRKADGNAPDQDDEDDNAIKQEDGSEQALGKGKKKTIVAYVEQAPRPMTKLFYTAETIFEFFSWNRIIWDEVSYKNPIVAQFVSNAKAGHKWLLSGTPPKQNLADVDYMVRCLGIHIAREVDLRMGHSPVTEGPKKSLRTETEELFSFGRMNSDKFVQERHAQGELCLQTISCSNKAPQVNVEIHEQVIICCSTIVEKAFYQDQQQEWRRAEMRYERIPEDILKEILVSMGHQCGDEIPQAIATRALIHAASMPMLADQTVSHLRERREERLRNVEEYLKPLLDKALWLAQHLEHCSKVKNRLNSTATLRRLIGSLQNGRTERFNGQDNYIVVLKAFFPNLDVSKQRNEILQIARDPAGIDLIKLRSNVVAKKAKSVDVSATLRQLNFSSWDRFYTLDPKNLKSLSMENMIDLYKEFISRHKQPSASQAKLDTQIQEAKSMKPGDLQNRLLPYVTEIHQKHTQMLKPLSNEFFEEISAQTNRGLENMCSLRGLKGSNLKKVELHKLLRDDEMGGAGQSNYTKPSIRALFPVDQVPLLNTTIKVRNSTVSCTHNELTETVHKLSQGIEYLITCADQLKRAKMFERLEKTGQLACDVCCGQDDLHVVFECGHVLCRNHYEGKELCGDANDPCPSVLRLNLIPAAKLSRTSRDLEFPSGFFKPSEMQDMVHGPGKRKHEEAIASGSNANKKFKTSTNKRSGSAARNASQKKKKQGKAYTMEVKMASSKIRSIVELVENIPEDHYVVLFSQFNAMLRAIQWALEAKQISCATITEGDDVYTASGTLESFKRGAFRVLALNQSSSTAAGSNLTIANHVIFATPFYADCQDTYESTMKQAIGRCKRRGQEKDVHVYHFVTEGTIEVDVLEARAKKLVRVQSGLAVGGLLDPKPRKDRNDPEQLMESEEEIRKKSYWYNRTAGPLERVNSVLSRQEVWNAMDENDYLVTIGFSEEEK